MPSITYNIDKDLSSQDDCLVIVPYVDGKPQALSPQTWLNHCTEPHTKELMRLLLKEEDNHNKLKSKKTHAHISSFHISYSQTSDIIKLLAGSGKFFFQQKPLYCDFFSKIEAYISVSEASNGQLAISIHLREKDQSFPLSECDFVCGGSSNWFIKKGFLKLIHTDISWKLLKKSNWISSEQEYQKLVNEIVDPSDPLAPKIERFTQTSVKTSPFPILKLKDRTGAFADLWMDYGNGQLVPYFNHGRNDTFRIIDEEQAWEKDLLETGFTKKFVENAHYFCSLDKVTKSLTFLLDIGWTILDYKEQKIVRMGNTTFDLQEKSNAFLVKGKVYFDEYTTDLQDVCGAFSRREKFIQLGNGTTGLLSDQLNKSSLQTLTEEGEIGKEGIVLKKHHLGLIDELFKQSSVNFDVEIGKLKERLTDFKGIESALPSPEFKGTLRLYQQKGLDWLRFLYDWGFHGLLADDMGLGKTVQVLAFLSQIPADLPHLIVLPSSLVFNWKSEIQRFLPSKTCLVHQGINRTKDPGDLRKQEIILTSYTTLRQDLPLFSAVSYHSLILDEAQYIKNHRTLSAQAVCSLNATFRLAITGTPIENHLGELWSHFHFLMPGLLDNYDEFMAQINAAQSDSRHLVRLQQKIRPFMLRRTKKEAAPDLPERIDQVLMIELTPTQRQIYDDYIAGVRGNLLKKVEIDGVSKHRIEILEAILRLRQICCHPALVSSSLNDEACLDSTKLDTLLNDLEQVLEEGSKALIYSQFTSMLSLIGKAMNKRGWRFVTLDGTTQKREEVVRQFQEDQTIPFFLISLKAGGVGLNLTAADYVFLYEPWWNEAAENQAIDRVHRIGREKVVISKRLVACETIEERMMSLKTKKRELSENLLEGTLADASISEDDLKYLLN